MLRPPAVLPTGLRLSLAHAVPRCALSSLPLGTGRPPWAWRSFSATPVPLSRGDDRISRVPGEPFAYAPCSSTPPGRCPPRLCGGTGAAFRSLNNVGPSMSHFRGSIAWLICSLSTLRSRGYPRTTQDSLAACWLGFGCAGLSPAGLLPRISESHRVPPSFEPGFARRYQTPRIWLRRGEGNRHGDGGGSRKALAGTRK
jgi:hypothetical protein